MTTSKFIIPLAVAMVVVASFGLAHAQSSGGASGSGPASSGAPMNGSTNGTTNGSNNGNAAATTGNGITSRTPAGNLGTANDREGVTSTNTMGASNTVGVTNTSGANNASSANGARR